MQGISVYKRAQGASWYVAYTSPNSGLRVNESSGIPLSDPQGRLKAYAYAREKSASGIGIGTGNNRELWGCWAEQFIRERYRNSPRTLQSYLGAWKFLAGFFMERKIARPRALTYQDVVDFVHWREGAVKASGKSVKRNTALHNLKVLSRLMREAIRKGYALSNPCDRIAEEITADPKPQKPEFTDDQIALVRETLRKSCAEWMLIAFEIALHQGCRLMATSIPMERLDFMRSTITFVEKGSNGKPTVFTTAMHPAIRPMLERLRDEGRGVTCELDHWSSRNFNRVLKRIGLSHSFHSTRVTCITRMARAGVPIQQAMAYVHHASHAIHQVYQRLGVQDLSACTAALTYQAESGSRKSQGANPATRRASRASNKSR